MSDDSADDSDKLESLYTSAVEQADDNWRIELASAMKLLQSQLQSANDTLDEMENFNACEEVIVEIAEENENASAVISECEDLAKSIASNISYNGGTDRIVGSLLNNVRELQRDQNETALNSVDSSDYTLDRGIGIDEYVEEHLVRVLKLDTLDCMSDVVVVFEFDDGSSVEFADNKHRNVTDFYDKVSVAAQGRQVRERYASLKARDDIDGDIKEDDYAEEKYRELSHGPEERAWGLDWNEVITHLEEDMGETVENPPAGPNTDAWEDLQAAIRNGRAARDKQSVVDAGVGSMYYSDEHDELWVPTAMVDNAIGDYATTRTSLVYELDARGVTTDKISAVGCSHADSGVSPPTRFWRLKASHADVPECTVVDEIDNNKDPFSTDVNSSGTTEFAEGDD